MTGLKAGQLGKTWQRQASLSARGMTWGNLPGKFISTPGWVGLTSAWLCSQCQPVCRHDGGERQDLTRIVGVCARGPGCACTWAFSVCCDFFPKGHMCVTPPPVLPWNSEATPFP